MTSRTRNLTGSLLLILVLLLAALPATAETVAWDYRLYPALEAVMTAGKDARIYTDNRASHYILTRYVVRGRDGQEWTEALDVFKTLRRKAPKIPAQWYRNYRRNARDICPSQWTDVDSTDRSVTFERRIAECLPNPPQVTLNRVIYGEQFIFTLVATVKGEISEETRQSWLAVLASATLRK